MAFIESFTNSKLIDNLDINSLNMALTENLNKLPEENLNIIKINCIDNREENDNNNSLNDKNDKSPKESIDKNNNNNGNSNNNINNGDIISKNNTINEKEKSNVDCILPLSTSTTTVINPVTNFMDDIPIEKLLNEIPMGNLINDLSLDNLHDFSIDKLNLNTIDNSLNKMQDILKNNNVNSTDTDAAVSSKSDKI
ncbi:hypothetical protein BCR32DRAFT_251818 [Anaeromyces robustus]|uniref:Uncharacterized protein n=1 Tax=Anaeromyces robustus TaxID=1754192 RepID=A0A1Y1VB03_9FUNG|nr:hypothetical protein BCR32DRAFT_251818 [Anaeromyces robustus]|eukprot:ORX51534.1 hypothetical protein BCR32DRAFT_251818 [Anaeromyces robustus]